MKYMVEMFCGCKSVSNVFKDNGYEVFTIDIDKKFEPDLCIDIINLNENLIPFDNIDVIWASPPCNTFSIASCGHHWNNHYIPKTNECKKGIKLLKKTIDVIFKIRPKYWFIENPMGLMRKMPVMKGLNGFHDNVTYCQYGDKRMKPTDIWHNNPNWKPKLPCKNGDSCHEAAPRGSNTGTQGLRNSIERAKIPYELCLEIFNCCNNDIDNKRMLQVRF